MRQTVIVADIVDGCSFRIGSGRTVLLSRLPPCGGTSLEARRARQYLEEKLLHRHVQMEEISIDPEGQILAQVWADGEEINQAMLEFMSHLQNPVEPSSQPPPIHQIDIPVDDIFKEEDQARVPDPRSPTPLIPPPDGATPSDKE